MKAISKVKFMSFTLVAMSCLNGYYYISQLRADGNLNAGIIANNEYTGLTSSYYKIEGQVGDILTDFCVDYKGTSVSSYTVSSDSNALVNTGKGLKLSKSGEGIALIKYNNATLEIPYTIKPDPNAVANESKEQEAQQDTQKNKHRLFKVTANGNSANGIIMYIDDSKNAFKTTGEFYIPENFLDNKTHAIYIAKFTKSGPVAYKVTEFTSLAGEINFMNYSEADVEIKDNNINLKSDVNKLY